MTRRSPPCWRVTVSPRRLAAEISVAAAGEIQHGEDAHTQEPAWLESSYSYANGNCVEVRRHPDGQVEVRNSRFPDQCLPAFTSDEWNAFVAGVNNGEFA